MQYRPDIDGLRAVAVLCVMLYHLGIAPFSGGYVGVDVFFVISGYLITKQLAGGMTVRHFFQRRIRRIVPALLAMLAASLAAGWLVMPPGLYEKLLGDTATSATFVHNIHFWLANNPLQRLGTHPLLHTWSLGVEAQFYVLFPLLLWAAQRSRHRQGVFLFACAASFIACVAATLPGSTETFARTAAFHLLPFRLWELLLGALLALHTQTTLRRTVAEGMALTGLVLAGYAVLAFGHDTAYPGMNALLPCVAAVLLIASDSGNAWITRLLAAPPLAFIGRISYSLYLWHWPLIVFARYALERDLLGYEKPAVIAASFVLALLSWRYIEQPFRIPSSRTMHLQHDAATTAAPAR